MTYKNQALLEVIINIYANCIHLYVFPSTVLFILSGVSQTRQTDLQELNRNLIYSNGKHVWCARKSLNIWIGIIGEKGSVMIQV